MKTVQISLNSIDKVKSFVNDITRFDYDFDLVSEIYYGHFQPGFVETNRFKYPCRR